jgi:hypothetical protein
LVGEIIAASALNERNACATKRPASSRAFSRAATNRIAHPLVGLASLTLVVAIYLFVEAILECVVWF